MSDRWFRAYANARHNSKLIKLDNAMRWAWFEIMCIASDNHGYLPPIEDMAADLRLKPREMRRRIDVLRLSGLLDEVQTKFGTVLTPHNWDARQFKSDISSSRVKAFRDRKKTRAEIIEKDADETFQKRSETVSPTFHGNISSVDLYSDRSVLCDIDPSHQSEERISQNRAETEQPEPEPFASSTVVPIRGCR